jgi:hypothetical protein
MKYGFARFILSYSEAGLVLETFANGVFDKASDKRPPYPSPQAQPEYCHEGR